MNIFASLDPSVKKLLGWKMGDEEEKWALKAVESLVKKLRKRKNSYIDGGGTVEDLEYALAHPGAHSKCVTIPRSLDGRLQVSHRKGLPHVIYCRVWRWPNVQSHHELKPTPDCMYPYDSRSEHICINPYHYQRPSLPSLPNTPRHATCAPPSVSPSAMSLQQSPGSEMLYGSHINGYCGNGPNSQSPFSATSPSALSDDDDFSTLGPMPLGSGLPLIHQTNNINNNMYYTNVEQWTNNVANENVEYWCSICYYELNCRVGEPFKISGSKMTIDGFTHPSTDEERICLGLLSNVNRNNTIECTRRHIGRGVRFNCKDMQVTALNLSESPIFIQSRNANFKYGLQSTAVCRVPPNSSMVVFDYQLFHNMLEKAKSEGYNHVYELQKMCFVRMSFVKGWGIDYHRQDVTSTPCWIEMQLHQPLAWIDSVLAPMDPPDHLNITSVS
ncbi:MH2 domain-containing protein [Ditylenchus destructor]|uniref:Mothers against decapentaplegic homolog n=1 Tax=Ditylenchus destructor TaxID=166010 RepID=A0AAD4MW38_9BILA|nr:MH2 domain-containing protein [Ditylenchus destructor]